MSKPVFEELFTFSGRRNRQSYALLLLAQVGALISIGVIAAVALAIIDSVAPVAYLLLLVGLIIFVGLCVCGWASGSQRIRDFGQSGVWILLVLIPYVGWVVSLAILFIPSTHGENKYGPSCI
jgi:uncharacterized membrane protein YhaH (DUF805 family)